MNPNENLKHKLQAITTMFGTGNVQLRVTKPDANKQMKLVSVELPVSVSTKHSYQIDSADNEMLDAVLQTAVDDITDEIFNHFTETVHLSITTPDSLAEQFFNDSFMVSTRNRRNSANFIFTNPSVAGILASSKYAENAPNKPTGYVCSLRNTVSGVVFEGKVLPPTDFYIDVYTTPFVKETSPTILGYKGQQPYDSGLFLYFDDSLVEMSNDSVSVNYDLLLSDNSPDYLGNGMDCYMSYSVDTSTFSF